MLPYRAVLVFEKSRGCILNKLNRLILLKNHYVNALMVFSTCLYNFYHYCINKNFCKMMYFLYPVVNLKYQLLIDSTIISLLGVRITSLLNIRCLQFYLINYPCFTEEKKRGSHSSYMGQEFKTRFPDFRPIFFQSFPLFLLSLKSLKSMIK